MLGPSFSLSDMPLGMLNGPDAEVGPGTGVERVGPTGAVGASCSTCAVLVIGAIFAASALTSSSADFLTRASVLAILRLAEPAGLIPSTASSSSKVRLRETISRIFSNVTL